MAGINIQNRSTILRKSLTYGVATFFSLGLLSGGYFISNYFQTKQKNKNEESIVQTIKKGDYASAENILKSTKDDKLPFGSKAKLEIILQKEKLENIFTRDLERFDLVSAEKTLEQMAKSGFFDSSARSYFEGERNKFTEEGLFERIKEVDSKKINLCGDYLSHYSSGKNKNKVIEFLLDATLEDFFDYIHEGSSKDFSELHEKTGKLNETLEKYRSRKISLSKSSVDKVYSAINNFGFSYSEVSKEDLKIGGKIKAQDLAESSFFNEIFLEQRNKLMAENSTGTIVDIDGSNAYFGKDEIVVYVKFDNVDSSVWKQNWNPVSKYWANGKKNVAPFLARELAILKDDLKKPERGKLNQKLHSFKELVGKYSIIRNNPKDDPGEKND